MEIQIDNTENELFRGNEYYAWKGLSTWIAFKIIGVGRPSTGMVPFSIGHSLCVQVACRRGGGGRGYIIRDEY